MQEFRTMITSGIAYKWVEEHSIKYVMDGNSGGGAQEKWDHSFFFLWSIWDVWLKFLYIQPIFHLHYYLSACLSVYRYLKIVIIFNKTMWGDAVKDKRNIYLENTNWIFNLLIFPTECSLRRNASFGKRPWVFTFFLCPWVRECLSLSVRGL